MKVNNAGMKPANLNSMNELANNKKSDKAGPKSIFDKDTSSVGNNSKVELSARAQQMQKAKEVASKDTVNESRVAQLQKLIDRGEYKTDAGAIADRMVDEHFMMSSE